MRKVLVWDGDESLWRGTLVEGDTPQLPDGRLALMEELYQRGVVQSIASKNLMDDVLETMNKLGITKYILLPQADFERTKSDMLHTIRDGLGLAKWSDFVFLDDQEFNLAEVESVCEDITALDPNQHWIKDELLDELFWKDEYNETDRRRVEMYREELLRKQAQEGYQGDKLDFLRSCGLVVSIHPPREEQMARVYDLVERANQLSASAGEYDELRLHSASGELYVVEAHDKFGDYGVVGVMHYVKDVVNLLVISCRMQGKGIGSTFLGHVLNLNMPETAGALWRETDYNKGMRALYEWYGFEYVGKRHDDLIYYEKDMDGKLELPDWVTIEE